MRKSTCFTHRCDKKSYKNLAEAAKYFLQKKHILSVPHSWSVHRTVLNNSLVMFYFVLAN